MDTHQFLEQQSKEYKSHLENRARLENAIKYHHQIKVSQTIPRQFKPKVLNPVSRAISLHEEFEKEYSVLFFNHLDKVIIQNQVSKELEEGVLQAIIANTIQHLCQLDKPLAEIQHLYYTFIHNNIPDENIPVELKAKIQVSSAEIQTATTTASAASTSGAASSIMSIPPSPMSWNKNRKRKGTPQPPATKKSKHHFLDRGHLVQQHRIHNFSTYELTKSDMELLSKGLSFVPTPKVTPEKMHIDLLRSYDKFAHSLRVQFIKQQKKSRKESHCHMYKLQFHSQLHTCTDQ